MRRRVVSASILAVTLGVGLSACGGVNDVTAPPPPTDTSRFSCTSPSGAVDLPAAARALLAPVQQPTLDDIWASVSRTEPGGWAGAYVDSGKLVLAFVDPVAGEAALPTIRANLGYAAPGVSWDGAELRQVNWSFAQLSDWYRYILQTLPRIEGISFTGIDERTNALHFGVINETARTTLINALNAANIPCNLVRTDIHPYAIML